MRKILFTAFLLLATYTKAQDTTAISQQDDENKIYENSGIEFQPEYPGGMAAFYTFIGKNYVYPKGKDIQGKIIVSFVVEKDGWLSDFRVIRDLGYGTGSEAIRVLKRCKRWKAAEQNGTKVRCSYTLPIVLTTDSKEIDSTLNKVGLDDVFNLEVVQVKPEYTDNISIIINQIAIKYYNLSNINELNGKTLSNFVIEKDGTISNIEIINDSQFNITEDSINILKKLGKWLPAEHNGYKVRCKYSLEIPVKI